MFRVACRITSLVGAGLELGAEMELGTVEVGRLTFSFVPEDEGRFVEMAAVSFNAHRIACWCKQSLLYFCCLVEP